MLLAGGVRPACAAADPVFASAGPDADAYGRAQHYPVSRPSPLLAQSFLVGTYSRYDSVARMHRIPAPPVAAPFRRAAQELALRYNYQNGSYTLADYLDRNPATGLLIARDDTLLYEHYQYDRTDHDRFLSQSMAKTITAALLGIALHEGAIHSLDQPAMEYVPALKGNGYGETKLRDLLHMSSGMAFREDYDGKDDSAALGRMLWTPSSPGSAQVVAQFNTRKAPPGTRFYYAGIETEVLGLAITRATRTSLADYMASRIWQKIGAEADAAWAVDASDQEAAFCCVIATLRDWARFALLLAHDGNWRGEQVVPRDWVLAMTTVQGPWLAPGVVSKLYGYGGQVWLLPGERRQFALLGIHGQTIFVDPVAKLVLVHTAVRVKPARDPAAAELLALWHALVQQEGK